MGFIDKSRDDLSGNTLLVSDKVFIWDDEEDVLPEAEAPDETPDDDKKKAHKEPCGR